MNFGFQNVPSQKIYLNQAGLHTNAKYVSLTYAAETAYEYFDIELETADGRSFRERTFGPSIDRVYTKDKYANGKVVGHETRQEAFERVTQDISTKLMHLALCFVDKDTAVSKVSSVKTLKEFVEAVSKLIGKPEERINFLTIWKNSDAKQKSNLILADRVKWCEPFVPNSTPSIKLSKYQQDNGTIEKYPYVRGGNSDATGITNSGENFAPAETAEDDLPF